MDDTMVIVNLQRIAAEAKAIAEKMNRRQHYPEDVHRALENIRSALADASHAAGPPRR